MPRGNFDPMLQGGRVPGNVGMAATPVIGARMPQRTDMTRPVSDIASLYQTQYDEARRANESRYEDILGGYTDVHRRAIEGLESRTEQGLADIDQAYEGAAAAGQQRMASRGLYNSTIAETMQQGTAREAQAAKNRYSDEMLDRRLGYDTALTQSRLGFMERREDEYPSQQLLTGLAQAIGQAGPQGLPPEVLQLFQTAVGGGSSSKPSGANPGIRRMI